MKRMILMVLLVMSVAAVASDWQNRVRTLLNQNETATELDWRNKNLGNRDFEGLGIVSHVKKLDLSDNDFANDFPLTACLRAFPNLETLSINNNTRVTGFSIDKDYKNTTLKVLNVENSGCTTIPVYSFYKNFELETLDVSDSKQLVGFYGAIGNGDSRVSKKALGIHLRNVAIDESKLGVLDLETSAMGGIRAAAYWGLVLVGGTCLAFCAGISPCYCAQGPIPPFQYDGPTPRAMANVMINSTFVALASAGLGFRYLGGAIARRVLPNGGKITAVKYITSSMDEMV